jgi:hypothetical protein
MPSITEEKERLVVCKAAVIADIAVIEELS